MRPVRIEAICDIGFGRWIDNGDYGPGGASDQILLSV